MSASADVEKRMKRHVLRVLVVAALVGLLATGGAVAEHATAPDTGGTTLAADDPGPINGGGDDGGGGSCSVLSPLADDPGPC